MPEVNPRILTWAREAAGLSLEEAARAVGFGGADPAARLAAMEAGELVPTRRQLSKMAEKYRRPILTFYLPEPPAAAPKAHDFRRMRDRDPASEARVQALVRDVRVRQALVLSALQDMQEDEPLPFVGSVRPEQGPQAIADAMRTALDFDIATYRAARTTDDAFKLLREAVEQIGVYVLLIGNLGHHTSSIDPAVFRGFALADRVAPFIVINENDSRAAWSFTLLHELAHVFLGQTGISGYDGDAPVEELCDAAAARFLLAPRELDAIAVRGLPLDDLAEAIGTFAGARKVSRKMVTYNLRRERRISWATYRELSDLFDAERLARARAEGGAVDYYTVRRHRVGRGLTRLVDRMVQGGVLTSTKAGRVLGVKPTAVGRMTAGARAA
jgi:Zn-dependent peptidase ImmA (M78 family)